MGEPEVLLDRVCAAAEEAPGNPTMTQQALWSARRDGPGWLVADSAGDEVYRVRTCDDTAELGVLAQTDADYLARVLNAHAPLVEALARFLSPDDGHTETCLGAQGYPCLPKCAQARAALKLARATP